MQLDGARPRMKADDRRLTLARVRAHLGGVAVAGTVAIAWPSRFRHS